MNAIESGEGLINAFENLSRKNNWKKAATKGIYTSSKVRKEVMLSDCQGKVVINGWVYTLDFENLGGGVWRGFIGGLE